MSRDATGLVTLRRALQRPHEMAGFSGQQWDHVIRLARAGDAGAIAALHRLTGPGEMGHLFKALALWAPDAPVPPGFEPLDKDAHDAGNPDPSAA